MVASPSHPTFAVIFKTHVWDEFVQRQLARLCQHTNPDDVFVVYDETSGPFAGLACVKVFPISEAMYRANGYLCHPPGNVFWYNADYPLYEFAAQHPEYDYVVSCEYDCIIDVAIADIVRSMSERGLEFVGNHTDGTLDTWYWLSTVRPHYPKGLPILGRLTCFSIFSRRFAMSLRAKRLEFATSLRAVADQRAEDGRYLWPYCEAFVGAEIALHGIACETLSHYGSTARYEWAPPYHEDQPSIVGAGFVHPVLDSSRFMQSIVGKMYWRPTDLFDATSKIHLWMEVIDVSIVVPMFLAFFATAGDWASIAKLDAYAARRAGAASRSLLDIARGKPTSQSTPTESKDHAWRCIDLRVGHPVREIKVYPTDAANPASRWVASGSKDLAKWTTVGSIRLLEERAPVSIRFTRPVEMRFLRIQAKKPNMFSPVDEMSGIGHVEMFV